MFAVFQIIYKVNTVKVRWEQRKVYNIAFEYD